MRTAKAVVFRDTAAPRTFDINDQKIFKKLRWVWLGAMGVMVLIAYATLSTLKVIALKKQSPVALEEKIESLTNHNQSLQAQLADLTSSAQSNGQDNAATKSVRFQASSFGSLISAQGRTLKKIPIVLVKKRAEIRGKTASVSFALQYIAEDGKSQQGRIIILAKGPETLMAYPRGVLNLDDNGAYLKIKEGESFSVSRYREAQTTFPVLTTPEGTLSLRDIRALIYDDNGSLMISEKIDLEKGDSIPTEAKAPEPTP